MGSRRSGDLFGHLETLFRDGAIGGLSDAQLLERLSPAAMRPARRRSAPGGAARADGAARLPERPARSARRRGCVPGDLPDPGAEGRLDPETGVDRELAARDGASRGAQGQDRGPTAQARESRVAEAAVSRESQRLPSRIASSRRSSTRRSSDCPRSTGRRSCSATWRG